MKRTSRKNSRLQSRIDELQRELERVESHIEQLNEAVNVPDQETAVRRLRRVTDRRGLMEGTPPPAAPAPEPVAAAPVETARSAGEPLPTDAAEGLEPGNSRLAPDRRFASYFVTGSLHSVRPLRTERRIQRNKAIFMAIFAVALLYWVISAVLSNR